MSYGIQLGITCIETVTLAPTHGGMPFKQNWEEVTRLVSAQDDVLMVDVSDAVDRELALELRRAENGGRGVESEVEELSVGGVLGP